MSYELHNDAGEHMQLLRGEWEMLLELARLEGWVPARGDLDHYASGGTVSLVDAAGLAAAIRRALPNVPAHYADGLAEEDRDKLRTFQELKVRPGDHHQGDPFAYFGRRGRNTLINFANKMASRPFEVELMPSFSPEF
jgi:hypothetical protein